MPLSDYNFTSVSCERSASSLTLPNTTGFLEVLWFPSVRKLEQIGQESWDYVSAFLFAIFT